MDKFKNSNLSTCPYFWAAFNTESYCYSSLLSVEACQEAGAGLVGEEEACGQEVSVGKVGTWALQA